MKLKILTNVSIVIISLLALQSCQKEDEGSEEQKVSEYNAKESHNMGINCMNCHKSGGSGEGIFNVAGTIYNDLKTGTYANATVKLFTEPNGAGVLKYTVEADAFGNFYTTENIEFGGGLYASVKGNTQTNYMLTPVTAGQCNSCHGISTDKIWTN
ncbi:MAG: hypothetical protein Q7T92_09500 [Lutibacter sp.]|nr:hypothetical protein [Lutibacter sp.]